MPNYTGNNIKFKHEIKVLIFSSQKIILHVLFSFARCSSFSGKEEGQTEKEKQIDQIYFAYGKKLSPIAEVRYKALDIKDESLGSLFEKFHSEMHNIDTMILSALKASFEVF